MSERTVTLTIVPDFAPFIRAAEQAGREMRAFAARMRGQKHLAAVIREQPGRRIVREGLADVLEWMGEKP